jgi:hypothetical protein
MKRTPIVLGATVLAGLAMIPFSCAKKDGDDSGSESSGTDGTEGVDGGKVGTVAISTDDIAATYPAGLAVTALPQSVDPSPGQPAPGTVPLDTAALQLQDMPPVSQPANPPAGNNLNGQQPSDSDQFKKHPKETLTDVASRLDGTAAACFRPNILSGQGPQNLPESICFGSEYGIISGKIEGVMDAGQVMNAIKSITPESARNPTSVLAAIKDASAFQASDNAEACMVVKGREYVAKIARQVNDALDLLSGMICTAKKSNPEVKTPAVGESIDLTTAMNEAGLGATVESAIITRKPDADGRVVLLSEVTYTANQANSAAKKIRLIHSPSETGEYSGALQIIGRASDSQQNQERDELVSLGYVLKGTTVESQILNYEVREARFVRGTDRSKEDPLEYFGSDGRLDVNAVDPDGSLNNSGNANKYLSGMNYFVASINPSSYAGQITAWNNPGGGSGESARGFVFSTTAQEGGTVKGCAWAGATRESSIRKAIKTGAAMKPDGCYTPQMSNGACEDSATQGSGTGGAVGPQVWKQCFAQNADGIYEVDPDNTEDETSGFDVLKSAPADIPSVVPTELPSFGT